MSTQRYISTSFWDDAWIQELDPSEKLLYIYLLTNPLTNIAGVYKLTRKRMVFDTGFNSDTIGHILAKFEIAKKVWVCGEYVIIRSWTKHQKWETSDKIKKGIDSILLELPREVLLKCAEINFTYDLSTVFDTLSIPYPYSTNYLDLNLNLNNINNTSDSTLDEQTISEESNDDNTYTHPEIEEILEAENEEELNINKTETVTTSKAKPKSSKPKQTKKESEEYAEKRKAVMDTYLRYYKSLTGKNKPDTWNSSNPASFKIIYALLKKQLSKYSVDILNKVFLRASQDTWFVEHTGYNFMTILKTENIEKFSSDCFGKTSSKQAFDENKKHEYGGDW